MIWFLRGETRRGTSDNAVPDPFGLGVVAWEAMTEGP
jgi:hypothetical protein